MQEALDILFGQEEDEAPAADTVYIAPPEPAIHSDEDSGDEDGGGTSDNLNARQLTAEAEIRFNDARDDVTNFEPILTNTRRTWIPGTFESNLNKPFPVFNYDKYKDFSLVELFELFIDEDIIDHFVRESNRYATFINCGNPDITANEVKCFIGILILSGYNVLPNRRLYWDSHGDTKNELVGNAMRRNRFEQILRFLHCSDNTQMDPRNKMWKIQPLVDKVKKKCSENFVPEQNLSYDESMVKYYGRHSCKQFIKNKPIRFGYKIWCLCTSEGYLINFDIYQGKSPTAIGDYQKMFGKASAPLVQMIDAIPANIKQLPYHFFFDNLFTGMNLLSFLREKGYGGTGTVRQNRLTQSCPLALNKHLDKKERGYHENCISKEDGVLVLKWKDNSVVSIASNCVGVEPISNVKRYSQKEKKIIHVPCPQIIGEYNRSMGGVDRLDENVEMYRIHIRNKKWYWALFSWLLDVSTHNAWLIARRTGKKLTQLEFRREIVQVYLTRYGNPPKGGGRPAVSLSSANSSRVSDAIRFDETNHLIQKIEKKRRCAGDGCNKKTSAVRTQCGKCNVGLCVECFEGFHKTKK